VGRRAGRAPPRSRSRLTQTRRRLAQLPGATARARSRGAIRGHGQMRGPGRTMGVANRLRGGTPGRGLTARTPAGMESADRGGRRSSGRRRAGGRRRGGARSGRGTGGPGRGRSWTRGRGQTRGPRWSSGRSLSPRPSRGRRRGGGPGAVSGGRGGNQPMATRRRGPGPTRYRASPGPMMTRRAAARKVPFARLIRRSPARRRPQVRSRLGVLPQNGARKGQGCAATPCCAGAGERAEV